MPTWFLCYLYLCCSCEQSAVIFRLYGLDFTKTSHWEKTLQLKTAVFLLFLFSKTAQQHTVYALMKQCCPHALCVDSTEPCFCFVVLAVMPEHAVSRKITYDRHEGDLDRFIMKCLWTEKSINLQFNNNSFKKRNHKIYEYKKENKQWNFDYIHVQNRICVCVCLNGDVYTDGSLTDVKVV